MTNPERYFDIRVSESELLTIILQLLRLERGQLFWANKESHQQIAAVRRESAEKALRLAERLAAIARDPASTTRFIGQGRN